MDLIPRLIVGILICVVLLAAIVLHELFRHH